MIYTDMTKLAMKICFEKHKEQVDKGGIPYPFHPFHLAESMTDEETTCVALLHDVLEDTDTTYEELYAYGFPVKVLEAVLLVTHDEEDSYPEYIERIKKNSLARTVKIADLRHNSDFSRLNEVTQKDRKRLEKYQKALGILLEGD